jgi:hypothetical protein
MRRDDDKQRTISTVVEG